MHNSKKIGLLGLLGSCVRVPNLPVRWGADMAQCDAASPLTGNAASLLSQRCNLQPCPVYTATLDATTSCDAVCGTVTCTTPRTCLRDGILPVDASLCTNTEPVVEVRAAHWLLCVGTEPVVEVQLLACHFDGYVLACR